MIKIKPLPQRPAQIKPLISNNYWFVLGRQPLLSLAEIKAVFLSTTTSNTIKTINKNKIISLSLDVFNPKIYINRLSGVIKIAQEIGTELSDKELEQKIIEKLKDISGKIHFGLSYYGHKFALKDVQKFGLNLKTKLKSKGHSIRFVQNKDVILSSATVKNNKLNKKGGEFLIYQEKDKYSLAITKAVQPFDKFSQRDYGRPGRDNKSGMLPPKLAMIMINLSRTKNTATILDPFCGSGTIITEGLLLGYKNIIGTDISEKAIANTNKNINWIIKNNKLTNVNIKLYQCDVINILSKIKINYINTIITEPFMGKPLNGKETKQQLQEQAGKLKKLYVQSFKQFNKIIKKGGIVMFIIPRFKFKDNWVIIDFLKEINKLGFVPQNFGADKCLIYGRPNQYLAREIWRFIKK